MQIINTLQTTPSPEVGRRAIELLPTCLDSESAAFVVIAIKAGEKVSSLKRLPPLAYLEPGTSGVKAIPEARTAATAQLSKPQMEMNDFGTPTSLVLS
jgi:hypothetical protein